MAVAPDGNIMDGSVYAVFKSNKKLGGDFDQFERDHEPMMQIRAYEQQFHVASYKVNEALKKLGLEGALEHPTMAELKPELERRMAMITDAKGLKAKAKKALDKLKELSTKADQETAVMRKKISDHIASVFPAVKEDLIKIEAHISGEITRLTQENGKLHREIATLISSAGTADSMDQLKTFLADELKRAEATSRQDAEEVKRLRGIEVNYLADEKSWNREKKRLEDELNSKMAALEKVQGEMEEKETENVQLERELREQRCLTKDANDKLQDLEMQKETVDGKLVDALEKARSQEFRANGLSLDLENALETCRERQEKIDDLTSRIEAPKPLDADGKARIAMRALKAEIDTHQEKTEKLETSDSASQRRSEFGRDEALTVRRTSENIEG
jgi:chromosome segregation ATPase